MTAGSTISQRGGEAPKRHERREHKYETNNNVLIFTPLLSCSGEAETLSTRSASPLEKKTKTKRNTYLITECELVGLQYSVLTSL